LATIFTRIIEGELPAHFVWRDERCVAFLSINPLRAGHTLVVPREEVDHWLDLDPALTTHLMEVSRSIGKAIQQAYKPEKVGFILAGLEVPHLHIHLTPIDSLDDINFDNVDKDPDQEDLADAARKLREELTNLGFENAAS
jgi:histidine triad (HIT) family protein